MFRTNELQTFYKHGFVGTSQKSAYNINAGKIKNPENPMISGLRAFDFFNTAEREGFEPITLTAYISATLLSKFQIGNETVTIFNR